MRFYDRNTGLFIEDSSLKITTGTATDESLRAALSKCILSASGWRAVMAASGDEEDSKEDVNEEMLLIAAAAAVAFLNYLGKENPRIILGSDARPTGRLLSAAVRRAMIAKGAELDDIYISSAPEIMAASHRYDGFFYISASHNPVGHNGYKFGVEGGVYPKEEMDKIIPPFKAMIEKEGAAAELRSLLDSVEQEKVEEVLHNHNLAKRAALETYRAFVMRTAHADSSFTLPFGVAIDFNGSARAASIDMPFLRSHDAKIWAINSSPRQIEHAIVPEGENLEWVRKTLEEVHSKDSSFIIGYMPDNGLGGYVPELMSLIAVKGSVAVDGASLTVTATDRDSFCVSLIPHTCHVSLLGSLKPGDRVNVEADVFARYVARILSSSDTVPAGKAEYVKGRAIRASEVPGGENPGGLTLEFLKQNGF